MGDREYEEYIEQVEQREEMIFDDPRLRPRDGVTLIRRRCGRMDLETFTPIFIHDGGMPKVEATAMCQRAGGILLDNVEPQRAEQLAAALQQAQEECFIVPAAEVAELPREQPVHGARVGRQYIELIDAAGHPERALWEDGIILSMGKVALVTEKTVTTAKSSLTRRVGGVASLGPATVAVGAAMSPIMSGKLKRKSSQHTLVDLVFLRGLRRYRIDGRAFDYTILRDTVQQSSETNVRLLVRWFLQVAPHLETNFDARKLVDTGDTDLESYDEHGFDDVVHWMVNMVKFRDR